MSTTSGTRSASSRPTLSDVAARSGVSRQTVSNVLNSPHLVRPETLDRVRQAIDELDYRPHLAARQMRTRRSRLLALRMEPLRDGINGVVLDRFLHALTEHSQEHGYQVLLFTADDDAGEVGSYERLTATHEIDAFVLTSTHHGDHRTAWLRERGLTFVTFGRPWGGEDAHDWVDVDGSHGTAEAVAHLVASGHERIGFVGWPQGSGSGDDRRAGWARAAADHGLRTEGLDVEVPDGVEHGRAAAERLLGGDDPATALVCASDSLAVGALQAVRQRGLQAGADVGVVGFDDTVLASTLGLSSVAQPIDEVAAACVRRLVTQLDPVLASKPSLTADAPSALLAPHLVVRESSRRAHPHRPGARPGPSEGAPA
ncbi:LacI family DNA-binding transcriptional regulator [Angustibacter peucedani]